MNKPEDPLYRAALGDMVAKAITLTDLADTSPEANAAAYLHPCPPLHGNIGPTSFAPPPRKVGMPPCIGARYGTLGPTYADLKKDNEIQKAWINYLEARLNRQVYLTKEAEDNAKDLYLSMSRWQDIANSYAEHIKNLEYQCEHLRRHYISGK